MLIFSIGKDIIQPHDIVCLLTLQGFFHSFTDTQMVGSPEGCIEIFMNSEDNLQIFELA